MPPYTRPYKVEVASKLLYTSFVIDLMLSILDDFLTDDLFSFGGLFGLSLFFWLYWAVITLIGRGHKKTLIVFLALVTLNWLFVLAVYTLDIPVESWAISEGIISPLADNWLVQIIHMSSSILKLSALYLLFQKSSFDWFKKIELDYAN